MNMGKLFRQLLTYECRMRDLHPRGPFDQLVQLCKLREFYL